MKINMNRFVNILYEKTGFGLDDCNIINDIFESHFIFGKKNKYKILKDLSDKLNINKNQAEEIYNISVEIISSTIKDKLLQPFKSQD